MKNLFPMLAVLSVSVCAHAGSWPVECAKEAYHWLGDSTLSTRLCVGAKSLAPVDCAKAAFSEIGDANLSVALCQQATSTDPVDCVKEAHSNNGGDWTQAVILCAAVNN